MIRGKYAIVTGASRGIGLSVAKKLVENGCMVVLTARNDKEIDEVCTKLGKNAIPLVWDISKIEEIPQKLSEAKRLLGGFDILVNNAGIFSYGEWSPAEMLSATYKQWQQVMTTNCDAVYFMMQAAIKDMLNSNIKGNILNFSSAASVEPVYGAYGASKTIVTALTRGFGKMFAKNGIVINGIAPGPVATAMNNWHNGDSMEHPAVPFGRFLSADEVGDAAIYMLSKEAEMICGETLIIDGAYSIR